MKEASDAWQTPLVQSENQSGEIAFPIESNESSESVLHHPQSRVNCSEFHERLNEISR